MIPRFDWDYITKLILARNWKSASEQQRARFVTAFQGMLLKTYADALLEYHDAAEVQWLPTQNSKSGDAVRVRSQLVRDEGPPIPIGFAMHKDSDVWKIYDISIESISLVTSFRGQFNAEIRNNGLDALIERLESTAARSAAEARAGLKS